MKLLGEKPIIINRENDDIGLEFDPAHVEGPWMIKKNNKYVLFTAAPYWDENRPENDSSGIAHGYWTGVSVADNVWGPYSKLPNLFMGGHISVFTGPDGKEWFSYRGEAGGEVVGVDGRAVRGSHLDIAEARVEEAGLEFVTAYDAFTRNAPTEESERIYVIARECGQSKK